jgi:predicted RNA binding protein YcfA (HicA-like mRNA interferase family)
LTALFGRQSARVRVPRRSPADLAGNRFDTVSGVPMKISEIIRLLEADGWVLKRVTGSHQHYAHPVKLGLVTVAGKPSATLKAGTEASILKQAGLGRRRP